MITFVNPLVFVTDMDESLDFYRDVLRREPIERDEHFVLFDDGFALHDGSELLLSIYPERPRQTVDHWGRDNLALYFESDDLDGDHRRLAAKYPLIHPLRQEPWGARIFRLHDPDHHVVEIGEPRAGGRRTQSDASARGRRGAAPVKESGDAPSASGRPGGRSVEAQRRQRARQATGSSCAATGARCQS